MNTRHKLSGHLLSGRYKSPDVDGSGNGYFKTACDYIHLNPVRAGLLKSEDSLAGYLWSERDLVEARKSEGRNLAIAARVRRETTLPLKQIAPLLHLGTSNEPIYGDPVFC